MFLTPSDCIILDRSSFSVSGTFHCSSSYRNFNISSPTRFINLLLAKWSVLPSNANVIMLDLKVCYSYRFSSQTLWNMFIIWSWDGEGTFFATFLKRSNISWMMYRLLAHLQWYHHLLHLKNKLSYKMPPQLLGVDGQNIHLKQVRISFLEQMLL